jgi:hypothetical protein
MKSNPVRHNAEQHRFEMDTPLAWPSPITATKARSGANECEVTREHLHSSFGQSSLR